MYYNSAADSALGMLLGFIGTIWLLVLAFHQSGAAWLGSYRAVLQTVYRVQDLLGQRPAVPRAACFEPAWLHPAARDASCHRKHRHQCCDAVQESRFIRSGRWLHHWPGPAGPHLQYDSGLRPVSVPRRSAGRLFLRPAEN